MSNNRRSELHAGHRERLREKLEKFGLEAFNKHEQVEYLLTMVIPRKDTNEMAHELINTFGNYYNILNAERRDLEKINGIGKETSMFIKIMQQFSELYVRSKEDGKIKLSTSTQCVNYFKKSIGVSSKEEAYLAMLNDKEELIKIISVGNKGNGHETEIDDGLISKEVDSRRPKYLILFHTHPFGDVIPSMEDLITTSRLMYNMKNYSSLIVEHIIINRNKYYSFKDSGIIAELQWLVSSKVDYATLNNPQSYVKAFEIVKKGNN